MSVQSKRVLLIGSGYMAKEYLKVLVALQYEVTVVGRGKEKVEALQSEYPQFEYHVGGVNKFLQTVSDPPSFAINTVNIDQLQDVTCQLIEKGVKYIFVEKPGGIYLDGLLAMQAAANTYEANIHIAYNRRFFSSIVRLQKEVEDDGGIVSAHFEFTEWADTLDTTVYHPASLAKWVLSNSSHVIDTAFFLIGIPKEIRSIVMGQNKIEWHPSGSIFVGVGISQNNIPFTYHSNWLSPGRWSIEIMTLKRRFYLKPMEKLQQQQKGSVELNFVDVDSKLDIEFKPGLYLQTSNFLNSKFDKLLSLEEQIKMFSYYNSICGY